MDPSKVLHIRSLPVDAAEAEFPGLFAQFGGTVVKTLLLRGKNQAFVELADLAQAQNIVENFSSPFLRGRQIHIQYSGHKELTVKDQEPQREVSEDPMTAVAHVRILDMQVPITLDVLHHIFSRCGQVLRIVSFTRSGVFQALVQMATVQQAITCRAMLDGQNIYTGCCTLRVDSSKLAGLEVKFNSDKCWDYTVAPPPHPDQLHAMAAQSRPEFGGMHGMSMHPAHQGHPGHPGLPGHPGIQSHPGMHGGHAAPGGSTVVLVSNIPTDNITIDQLFTLFGIYADVMRIKVLFKNPSNALVQYRDPSQAQRAIQFLNGATFRGLTLRLVMSKYPEISMPRSDAESALTKDFGDSQLHRYRMPSSKNQAHLYPPSTTLHLSGLTEGVTEAQILEWFGVYGVVTAFRFFPSDRRMAVIAFRSSSEALEAIVGLHNLDLPSGGRLRVAFSKSELQPSAATVPGAGAMAQ